MPVHMKYITKLRIYATAEDVFCLTGYQGIDPGSEPQRHLPRGIEYLSYYPRTTVLTLGINVTF